MSVTEARSVGRSARDWAKALVVYRQPSAARGIFELVVTFPPFVAVWTAMLLASSHGLFWLSFALAPLAAGLLIRLFLIQHDCGHGSFFPNKHANDWVGRALGVLTVTPYDLWRRSHAIHHASSGNLDRRGRELHTVQEVRRLEHREGDPLDAHRERAILHALVVDPFYLVKQERVMVNYRGWGDGICQTWMFGRHECLAYRLPADRAVQRPVTVDNCQLGELSLQHDRTGIEQG